MFFDFMMSDHVVCIQLFVDPEVGRSTRRLTNQLLKISDRLRRKLLFVISFEIKNCKVRGLMFSRMQKVPYNKDFVQSSNLSLCQFRFESRSQYPNAHSLVHSDVFTTVLIIIAAYHRQLDLKIMINKPWIIPCEWYFKSSSSTLLAASKVKFVCN